MSASEVDINPTETKNLFGNSKVSLSDNDKGFVDDLKTQSCDLFTGSLTHQIPTNNNFSQCSSATPSISLDGTTTTSNSDLGIGRITSVDSGSLISPSSSQISPGPNHLLNGGNYNDQNTNASDNILLMRQRMMDLMNPNNFAGALSSDAGQMPDAFLNENSDLSSLAYDLVNSECLFPRPNDAGLLNKQQNLDQDQFSSNPWNHAQGFDEVNVLQSMFNTGGSVSPILSQQQAAMQNNSQVLQSVANFSKRPITGGQNRAAWNGANQQQQMKPSCSSPAPFMNAWGGNPQQQKMPGMMNGGRHNNQQGMNRQALLIGTDTANMSNSSPSSSPLGSAGSKSMSSTMSGSQSGGGGQMNSMYNMFPKRPHHRMMPFMKGQQNGAKMMDPSAGDHAMFGGGGGQPMSSDQQAMLEMMKSFDGMGLNGSSRNQAPPPIVSDDPGANGQAGPGLFSSLEHANSQTAGNDFMPLTSAIPPKEEGFSRKVFVGGLPPDIDEEEITTAFCRFGNLIVDWPHKTESKAYFPPKGYCFLLFMDERSVQNLINACILDEGKYYWCVSSPTMKDKPVQIRPWNLADSDFVFDGSQPLDPRKTIFVGGVPRPLKAMELALIMNRLYGGVCYAGIDTDPELKYPKGAGRVAFSNQQSYIAAISARFVQLQHNDIDKRVEVKPYVLDNQMCDECQGARCGGKFAPFFCANVTCLQYYCDQCWVHIHSRHGREYHKPLVKEGADRPRPAMYRW